MSKELPSENNFTVLPHHGFHPYRLSAQSH